MTRFQAWDWIHIEKLICNLQYWWTADKLFAHAKGRGK